MGQKDWWYISVWPPKIKKPQERIQSADITAGNRTCQVDCGGFGRPWHRRTVGPSRGPCLRRRLKEAQTLSSTKVAMLQRLPLVARPSNTATRSRWCFAAWGEASTEWGRYRDWGRSNLPVASASIHVVQVCRYKRGCCRFTQINKQLLYYLY